MSISALIAIAIGFLPQGTERSDAGSKIDVPAGIYSLEELASLLSESGDPYAVAGSEKDRLFAVSLSDVSPEDAWKSIATAAGDLRRRTEERGGKPSHSLVVDQSMRSRNRAVVDRVFSELRNDLVGFLSELYPLTHSYVEMSRQLRRDSSRALGGEVHALEGLLKSDPENRAIQRQLRNVRITGTALTMATHEWDRFGVEALWSLRRYIPTRVQELDSSVLTVSQLPEGAAILGGLEKHVPEGDLIDIIIEFSVSRSDDHIRLSPRVYAVLTDRIERIGGPFVVEISLQACNRPSLKSHYDTNCAHYREGAGTSNESIDSRLPESASTPATIDSAATPVLSLSRAVLLWAAESKGNIICELMPFAEQLSQEVMPGASVTPMLLSEWTKRWSLIDQDGVLVFVCDSRAIDSLKAPLKEARDAGLLDPVTARRVGLYSISELLPYALEAVRSGTAWSRRRGGGFRTYYGMDPISLDDVAIVLAVADGFGALADLPKFKFGAYPMKSLGRSSLKFALQYMARARPAYVLMHPLMVEELMKHWFIIEPFRGDFIRMRFESDDQRYRRSFSRTSFMFRKAN